MTRVQESDVLAFLRSVRSTGAVVDSQSLALLATEVARLHGVTDVPSFSVSWARSFRKRQRLRLRSGVTQV